MLSTHGRAPVNHQLAPYNEAEFGDGETPCGREYGISSS